MKKGDQGGFLRVPGNFGPLLRGLNSYEAPNFYLALRRIEIWLRIPVGSREGEENQKGAEPIDNQRGMIP